MSPTDKPGEFNAYGWYVPKSFTFFGDDYLFPMVPEDGSANKGQRIFDVESSRVNARRALFDPAESPLGSVTLEVYEPRDDGQRSGVSMDFKVPNPRLPLTEGLPVRYAQREDALLRRIGNGATVLFAVRRSTAQGRQIAKQLQEELIGRHTGKHEPQESEERWGRGNRLRYDEQSPATAMLRERMQPIIDKYLLPSLQTRVGEQAVRNHVLLDKIQELR